MTKYHRKLLPISVLLIGISVVAASSPTPTLTGKVVGIADGDTLTLLVVPEVRTEEQGTGRG